MPESPEPAPERPKVILGNAFIQELIAAGVLPERATKVIIEAEVGAVTRVHYSVYGDERLVGVVPAAAAKAMVVGADEEESAQ